MDIVLFELVTDELYALVGEYSDEQMRIGSPGGEVVDGAQSEFGFHAAEYGFNVG